MSKYIAMQIKMMSLIAWFFSQAVLAQATLDSGPYVMIFDVREMRISGDPNAASGYVELLKTPYSPSTSFLSAPPTWNLDVTIHKAMFNKALSAMVTDRAVTVSGEVSCSIAFSFCWRVVDEVRY